MACIHTTVVYPYYTVFEFPGINSSVFWWIMISEFVCLINIILNFFKQELDEQGQSKNESLEIIALKYFKSRFLFDLFLIGPIGYLSSIIDRRLKFLWIFKAFRVQ